MKKLHAYVLLLAAMAMAAPPLAAHHGRGQTFDMKKQVTLKGTVSQVKWQNPHVLIFIDVADDAGVGELGEDGGLAGEAGLDGVAVPAQHLEGDPVRGLDVDGEMDLAHAARGLAALDAEASSDDGSPVHSIEA